MHSYTTLLLAEQQNVQDIIAGIDNALANMTNAEEKIAFLKQMLAAVPPDEELIPPPPGDTTHLLFQPDSNANKQPSAN